MFNLNDVARFRVLNAHLYAQPWMEGYHYRDMPLPNSRHMVGFLCQNGLVRLFMTTNLPQYLKQFGREGDHFFAFPGGPGLRRFFKHWFADKRVWGSAYILSEEDIQSVLDGAPYRPE